MPRPLIENMETGCDWDTMDPRGVENEMLSRGVMGGRTGTLPLEGDMGRVRGGGSGDGAPDLLLLAMGEVNGKGMEERCMAGMPRGESGNGNAATGGCRRIGEIGGDTKK